jgi:hypothetical protein
MLESRRNVDFRATRLLSVTLCVTASYCVMAIDHHSIFFSGGLPNSCSRLGYKSVTLVHLANIAQQVGSDRLSFDPKTETYR